MPEEPTTADGYPPEYVARAACPTTGPDDSIQADVVGYVDTLLRAVDRDLS